MRDKHPEVPPQLPDCVACGKRTVCNLVRLANEESWYLCPEACMPALLEEARGWLKREQRHNEMLREAGEDGDDELDVIHSHPLPVGGES